jgi:hypothetical protein
MVSENDSPPRPQHDPWNKGRIIGHMSMGITKGRAFRISRIIKWTGFWFGFWRTCHGSQRFYLARLLMR